MQGAIADDCRDTGGRAMQGAIADGSLPCFPALHDICTPVLQMQMAGVQDGG